jgi:hypothetical protein
VFGDKRVVLATVDAAGTGDTYDTQLKLIQGLAVVPPSSTAVVARKPPTGPSSTV